MSKSDSTTDDQQSWVDSGLTASEDDELRQLTWFSMVGQLSEPATERILELRARDRRSKVRDPRPDPSASRTSPPRPAVPAAKLPSEPERDPTALVCPNCGFVQRKLPPTTPAHR